MTQQRKRNRGAQTRAQIAEAAVSVFAKKGYHGATIEEIAREASYSPAAVYKYFRNKDDVFHEVIRVIADDFDNLAGYCKAHGGIVLLTAVTPGSGAGQLPEGQG